MLGDVEIGLIAGYMASYRRNKRRLLRLRSIRDADLQKKDELVDDEAYIETVALEARILQKAGMCVSNSQVWPIVSKYLREVRYKPFQDLFLNRRRTGYLRRQICLLKSSILHGSRSF